MPTPQRPGLAAIVLGVAAWAQLSLAPIATGLGDAPSILAAALSLGVLAASVASFRTPPRAAALGLAGYPASLGVAAFFAGRHAVPRFDGPSRVLAAFTLLAYLVSAATWYGAHRVRVPVVSAAAEERSHPPAPALRRPALFALGAVALGVSVIGPALLGVREPATMAERVAGDALVRGRAALVTAAGTLLALALVLQGGNALLRATPARPRVASRAAAYVVWALCVFLMRHWLDRAR